MRENDKENQILDCVTESIEICKIRLIPITSSAKTINLEPIKHNYTETNENNITRQVKIDYTPYTAVTFTKTYS